MKNIHYLLPLLFLLIFSGCKINQTKNGEKMGRWVYEEKILGSPSISKGRYKNGNEVGTWKDYLNNRLQTKRKYKDSICYTTEYHDNGQISAVGISKMIIDSTTIHWFLSGEWKFYDSEGILLGTKTFQKGEPILETYND